ncbi:MAG: hypothetical protein LBR73_03960 [Oscillospiraceae bacterium]|jgi:hypothetical protein|nr:hypothetical protein [Oscillospiraceae bacterium]
MKKFLAGAFVGGLLVLVGLWTSGWRRPVPVAPEPTTAVTEPTTVVVEQTTAAGAFNAVGETVVEERFLTRAAEITNARLKKDFEALLKSAGFKYGKTVVTQERVYLGTWKDYCFLVFPEFTDQISAEAAGAINKWYREHTEEILLQTFGEKVLAPGKKLKISGTAFEHCYIRKYNRVSIGEDVITVTYEAGGGGLDDTNVKYDTVTDRFDRTTGAKL